MKMNWMELEAKKLAEPEIRTMLEKLDSEKSEDWANYMEHYVQLPEKIQCALGYMRCIVEAECFGSYSAYGRFCMDLFSSGMGRIPPMRLPFRFIGWGGEHNDIGPAYEIDRKCFFGQGSRLFYTDEDIEGDRNYTESLAQAIARESSGIMDVRAEKLEMFRIMNRTDRQERWCVTFRPDETAFRDIVIGGKPMRTGRNDAALFILPRAGEFECMLGEIVNGDPDNAFILVRHNYCMK